MITTAGSVSVSQPVKVKLPMPHDTEGLRYRLDLLKAGVEFMKIRHPRNRLWLSADEEMWKDHVDDLLGKEIMGNVVTNTDGGRDEEAVLRSGSALRVPTTGQGSPIDERRK